MKIGSLRYLFKEGFQNLWHNRFALAEGFVSSTPKSPQFFANPKLPATMTPIINAFGSVGLM